MSCDDKLRGTYRGKVLKHLGKGVLKVYIPEVYPAESLKDPDSLPDAEMVVPLFAGNCDGSGVFSYPRIGSVVICSFLDGDQNLPIVIGATQGGEAAAAEYGNVADELDSYTGKNPSVRHRIVAGRSSIDIYDGGYIKLEVNAKNGKTASITFDQDGDIMIECGKLQIKSESTSLFNKDKVNVLSQGDVSAFSNGLVHVQSKTGTNIVSQDGCVYVKSANGVKIM